MKIPLFKIYWDKNDISNVSKTIASGKNWAVGENVEIFEKMLAKYIGRKYSVVFNSGTSAQHALMLALGFKEGDEVIVPSFTFISTANCVLFVGAKPVFADIEKKTLGLDPKDVAKRITSKTKAIMPIHYGGNICAIKELQEIAKKNNLILIEDAAESLGASIDKKMIGNFSDHAILSFCQNKIITTGEGGAVVTDSLEVYEKLKLVRSHGRCGDNSYFTSNYNPDYISLGFNWRMSNISASLGISQLKKIDKIIKLRREAARYLDKELAKIPDISLIEPEKNQKSVYQMYTIVVNQGLQKREALKNFLDKKGISCKVYFSPVHLTSFYKKELGSKEGDLPVTEEMSDKVLSLPIYPTIKKTELKYIVNQIKIFFK